MANPITLLFVDLAAMLDIAAVATQAAQVEWDKTKPSTQLKWDNGAIRLGVVFLAKGLKHKKKEYWLDQYRDLAHGQARDVGTLAAKYAKAAYANATTIEQKYLQAALDERFPQRVMGGDEPCPF